MAKGFGKRLAHALTVGLGAGMEGYGKGSMEVAMRNREEYQQRLRDERAAAAAGDERTWREGEAEKGRGFEKEMFGEKQEWEKEKFGMEMAADEKKFNMQLALKKAGGGKGGSKESAYMKRARELEEAQAAAEGREPTSAGVFKRLQELNAKTSGRGSSESTYMKRARELETAQAAAEGRPVSEENIYKRLEELNKRSSGSGGDKAEDKLASDFQRDYQKTLEGLTSMTSTSALQYLDKPEEAEAAAMAKTMEQWNRVGRKLPTALQESKAEAPQPQELEAPATSTLGDKPTDATPQGAGTEASPYVVESEAQKAWFREHAPPGAWVMYGGKLHQKKVQ